MPLVAIISNVCANLEALTAVLADIDQQGISTIYCLGNTVGYGPDPVACLALVRSRVSLHLQGNLDAYVVARKNPLGSVLAARMLDWTRLMVEAAGNSFAWLATRPLLRNTDEISLTHSLPETPWDVVDLRTARENPERLPDNRSRLVIKGDSRTPWGYVDQGRVGSAEDLGCKLTARKGHKTIVDVGAVGRPRDHNPLACYAILEEFTVTWRRVDYDRNTTVKKILACTELSDGYGEQLLQGR